MFPTIVNFLAIFAFGSLAHAANPADIPRVSPDQFAILPWSWASPDRAALEDIYRCGFNLAGFVTPDRLEAVVAAKLKAIVVDKSLAVTADTVALEDAEVVRRVRSFAKHVAGRPGAWGVYLSDEPSTELFRALGTRVAALRQAAPTIKPYVNLFPLYATHEQLGADNYAAYLDAAATVIRPVFLSYDNYSLMEDGTLKQWFFENLEAMRAASTRHKLSFWNIVLAVSHFRFAEPTEAGLRLQVFATLAYGGRGVSYFTYVTPAVGNYRLGAIDPFGHKTPTWDMLQRVNFQLHRLAPTYGRLTWVNTFHHPSAPAGSQGIASSRYVESVDGAGSYLIGEFEDQRGRPWVLIVNKDLRFSANFGIEFKQPGVIHLINNYSGLEEQWAGENNWLAPGQGMLLTVRR